MDWKVIIRKPSGVKYDFGSRVSNISWSDSTDQLGAEFSFSKPFSKWDENYDGRLIDCGDLFLLYYKSDLVFQGVITEISLNGTEFRGYDLAWYLNQSETIIQFKNIRADKAIKQLLNKFEVPIGSIAPMKTTIKKVYKDETIADIINDIVNKVEDETDNNYRIEMRKGKFYIINLKRIEIKPTYKDELGNSIPCVNSAQISGTKNIEELRNYVIYANTKDGSKGIKSIAKSQASINKYGLLSVVETQENLTAAKAKQRAKNRLKRLNKPAINFTCEMRGNYTIRPGRWIEFPRTDVGIKGWYKVKSCTHTINNGIYTVSLEMSN